MSRFKNLELDGGGKPGHGGGRGADARNRGFANKLKDADYYMELAEKHEEIKFTKCNVDDNPVTPGKFGIKAIPTLIFFKDGNVEEQITGMVAKSKLEEVIKTVLSQ